MASDEKRPASFHGREENIFSAYAERAYRQMAHSYEILQHLTNFLKSFPSLWPQTRVIEQLYQRITDDMNRLENLIMFTRLGEPCPEPDDAESLKRFPHVRVRYTSYGNSIKEVQDVFVPVPYVKAFGLEDAFKLVSHFPGTAIIDPGDLDTDLAVYTHDGQPWPEASPSSVAEFFHRGRSDDGNKEQEEPAMFFRPDSPRIV